LWSGGCYRWNGESRQSGKRGERISTSEDRYIREAAAAAALIKLDAA
jgi:hypothetical protein